MVSKEKQDNIVKIHLEEYRALRDELVKKIEFEHQLLNYAIVIPSAFLTILNSNLIAGDHKILILLSPIIFFALGLVYAFNDQTIIGIARYINTILRVRLTNLLDFEDVLGYEYYVYSGRLKSERGFIGLVYFIAKIVIVIIGPVAIIIYSVWKWSVAGFCWYEKGLLGFDIAMVIISVLFRIKSWDTGWKSIVMTNQVSKKF